jgi:hypothetical protein
MLKGSSKEDRNLTQQWLFPSFVFGKKQVVLKKQIIVPATENRFEHREVQTELQDLTATWNFSPD